MSHTLYEICIPISVRISVLDVILAVGNSGDDSNVSSNRAEYFYPNDNRWKSAGKYPDVSAVYKSSVLYVENMFIIFGGVVKTSAMSQPEPSNLVMKLDEGTKKWTKLGLLNLERSSDENQVQRNRVTMSLT